jgi:hypothetical protein
MQARAWTRERWMTGEGEEKGEGAVEVSRLGNEAGELCGAAHSSHRKLYRFYRLYRLDPVPCLVQGSTRS